MAILCISRSLSRQPETDVPVAPKMNGKSVPTFSHESLATDHIYDSFQVRTQRLPLAGDPTRTPHESTVYCSPVISERRKAVRLLGYCRQARRRIILTVMTRERTFVDFIIQRLHDQMTREPPAKLELRKCVFGAPQSND